MFRSALSAARFREDRPSDVVAYLGTPQGAFAEVGAFDPVFLSQTWHLEQQGWSGLLIEPIAEHATKLREARTAKVIQAACCAPELHGTRQPIIYRGGTSTLLEANGDRRWTDAV